MYLNVLVLFLNRFKYLVRLFNIMKSELSSLDLYYLVKELQSLVGAKFNKIYQKEDDKKDLFFLLHKTGLGKTYLRIKLPDVAYITDYKQVFPETPPGFCTFLRKRLNNAFIKEIRQKGFDRILEIVIDTKEGRLIMVCELFSKGNMILIDEDYKIKGLLQSQNWESRVVRGGTTYEYPPSQTNTPCLDEEQFKKIILDSEKGSIVKSLAINLSLGGTYAEELCLRAGIDKGKKGLDDEEIKKLYKTLKELLSQDIKPIRVKAEVFPFELLLLEKQEKQSFESFNSAIDEIITKKIVDDVEQGIEKKKLTKEDKTHLIIEKQEERKKELEKESVENQRKGELIYEHYQEIDELLKQVNIDRKKMSWEELKKKYESNKMITNIDDKKGEVTIDL